VSNIIKWQTSAPANLMLMGEHSVVYGYPALACAVNQRLTIHWQSREDDEIHIHSALGNHQTHRHHLTPHEQLNWVMQCLQTYQASLPCGLNIKIISDFKSTLGLGSSAALLAAMLGGLDFICQHNHSIIEQFQIGLKIIHQIQGSGSGTDLAASLSGGVIFFDPQIPHIYHLPESLTQHLHPHLIYAGYKTPTAEVLKQVKAQWLHEPKLQAELYQLMGQTTQAALMHLQQNNLNAFYLLLNTYQGLLDALGVNDTTLAKIIYQARASQNTLASKISGSGLGDCALIFQKISAPLALDFEQIPIQISSKGMTLIHDPQD